MKFQDKVVVVTGGGNGLGRQLVLELLRRKARVAAVDINEPALNETRVLAAELSQNLTTHILNITDSAAVSAFPQQIIDQHGQVDGLINNAGIIQPFVRLAELEDAAIERVMQINFFGLLHMTRAFLPSLKKRPSAHITNISSMGGFLPVPGQTIYGASKAAVKLLTEGLHSELRTTAVRVTLALPGAMQTNIAENSGIRIDPEMASRQKDYQALPADQAARIILDAMEKDQYRVLVGKDARFMDLIYRLSPERAAGYIFKKMRALLPD